MHPSAASQLMEKESNRLFSNVIELSDTPHPMYISCICQQKQYLNIRISLWVPLYIQASSVCLLNYENKRTFLRGRGEGGGAYCLIHHFRGGAYSKERKGRCSVHARTRTVTETKRLRHDNDLRRRRWRGGKRRESQQTIGVSVLRTRTRQETEPRVQQLNHHINSL